MRYDVNFIINHNDYIPDSWKEIFAGNLWL